MARKRKKGSQNRQNAAGDSRVSVLTEDRDTYSPFKNIKEMDVIEKVNNSNNNIKNNKISKREDIVEKVDENVSFADIFGQWEKGGVVDNPQKKKLNKEKQEPSEDFAKIFNQWEVSQGIKPKQTKKVKEESTRKTSKYKPTKDFGQLLNQFENNPAGIKSHVKKVSSANNNNTLESNIKKNFETKTSVNDTFKSKKVENTVNDIKKEKIDLSKKASKYEPTKDFGQLLDQFENNPAGIKSHVKKISSANNNNTLEINTKKNLETKTSINNTFNSKKVENTVIDTKKEGINLSKNDNVVDKNNQHNFVEHKSETNNIEEKVDDKKVQQSISETKVETTKVNKNIAWGSNKKSDTPSNVDTLKSDSGTNKKSTPNRVDKYKQESAKPKPKPDKDSNNSYQKKASANNDIKWDFSDIYSTWESKHDEAAILEANKLRDKKESKGISISYLRSMKPEGELDLHGLISDIAALRVSEFLTVSRNKGLKKVSIITGKGNHSENGKAILRDVALEEIRFSNIVREASHPKAINGGTGVIWVIFKSTSEKKIYF